MLIHLLLEFNLALYIQYTKAHADSILTNTNCYKLIGCFTARQLGEDNLCQQRGGKPVQAATKSFWFLAKLSNMPCT